MDNKLFMDVTHRLLTGDVKAVAWLELWGQASRLCIPKAQYELGVVCETGGMGTRPDPQRAFFWYYQAGLAGEPKAKERAFELKRSIAIEPAIMDGPLLVSPGKWTMVCDEFGQALTQYELDLKEDSTVSGRVVGRQGPQVDLASRLLAEDPGFAELLNSMMQNITVAGQWSFDRKQNSLRLQIRGSVPGVRDSETGTSRIAVLGVGEKLADTTLFGRDEAMAGYYFDRVRMRPDGATK
jgi:hypothetical protein